MSSTQTIKVENRRSPRVASDLKAIVQVKESDDDVWKEVTFITTISRNGAGFSLTRSCEVGRLVSMVLPMPSELRAYNFTDEIYPIIGLVQHCNEVTVDGKTVYHIGVGFIGKEIPESFKSNSRQSYRFCGMTEEGLWQVTEAEAPFKARKDPRFWKSLELTISLMKKGKKSETSAKETALTRDISSSGVSVPCSLDVAVDDRVKVANKEFDFYSIAVVRNRKESESEDQPPTLHLEFVDQKFPMQKILFANAADLN